MPKSGKTNRRNIWHYRGHRLKKLEWGLWTALGEPGRYFLCYRPRGRDGPVIRRWAIVGPGLTVEDLRQHVRTVRSQIQARKLGLPSSVTCMESLGGYLKELQRQNRTPEHIKGVRQGIERFLSDAGVETLREIACRDVERFLQHLNAAGASARTQNKYRAHLHSWLAWARRHGDLSENPVALVPRATQVRTLVHFPSPEQMVALVEKAPCRYDAAMWTFLVLTGLRRGSFLSLRPDCFQKDGILVPETKRRTEWFISYSDGCPLWGPELSKLGRRIWAERPPKLQYVRVHWQTSCQAAGLHYTLHSLRHAFCSWLMMMGEQLADIAAWAHHATQATTERYAHLRPRGRERIAENRGHVFTIRARCLEVSMERRS